MGNYTFVNKTISRPSPDGKTEVFVSDMHFPHHHAAAYDVTLAIIKYIKPEIVYLGGDIVDNKAVSRHPKTPVDKLSFKADLLGARRELARMRKAAPTAEIIAREGNHDQWLQSYLNNKAEELSMLDELKFPALFHLDKLGIEWVEAGTREKIGRLWHIHGHEVDGGGVKPARAKFSKMRANVIFGHHHKFDTYLERNYEGEMRGAWANGCLYTESPEYTHHTEWTLGFSVIKYVRGGFFEVQQVPIHQQDGVAFAVYNGKLFEAAL